MTARNTAASTRAAKRRKRIVRTLLRSIIAAGSPRHHYAPQKRGQARDERDLDQRVRECGEW